MAIENLKDLEEKLKLPDGTLKAAIDNTENVKIAIPELLVFTKDEDATRVQNLKNEAKTAGVEIAIKEARTSLGLDFQGKTMENLLNAHKEKVVKEAGIAPDAKVTELTKDNGLLKENLNTLQGQFDTFKTSVGLEKQQNEINNHVLSKIPANITIDKGDMLTLFNSRFQTEKTVDGKIVFKKDGAVLKNTTTLDPLSAEEVLSTFVTPYLKKPEGGAGGVDDPGNNKPGSLAAFEKEMKDKGVNSGSLEFNQEMAKRITNKTLVL